MDKWSLKKFIADFELEWHWNWSEDEVYMQIPKFALADFSSLFDEDYICECDIKLTLCTRGYVSASMKELCEDHGVEMKEVFNKPSWDSDEEF